MDELEHESQVRFSPGAEHPRAGAARRAPRQLRLFGEPAAVVVVQSATQTEEAVSEALQMGWSVRLKRSSKGFELSLRPPVEDASPREAQASTCGFSRRVSSRLLREAEATGSRLWARPAGPSWPGWMEWGTLPPAD